MQKMSRPNKRAPGRPPKSERFVSREVILKHALECFAREGYEGASMRAMSRDLGGSPSMIQSHFASKDDLWTACVDFGVGAFEPVLEQINGPEIDPDRSEVQIRELLKSFYTVAANNPELIRIMMDEGGRGGPRLDYVYEKMRGSFGFMRSTRHNLTGVPVPNLERLSVFFLTFLGAAMPFALWELACKHGIEEVSREEAVSAHVDVVIDMQIARWKSFVSENES